MYKIAIPITNRYPNRSMDVQGTLKELQKAGAHRVWLCTARGIESEEILQDQLRLLKEHRRFFEENGLEVGAWLSTLGHGGALSHQEDEIPDLDHYQKIVGFDGSTCEDGFCPSDERFADRVSTWIGRIAQTGIRMIMLDDDFRLSLRPNGSGCCCEAHMAEYSRRVGKPVRREEMRALIFSGGPNKYRDAWLDMCHDALIGLAQKIRARVDEADPTVRVGVCAVMSTWDLDGVNAMELTRVLAGGTKPFLRTIDAPYWAAINPAQRLSVIFAYARLQRYWCRQSGIELFTEGDAYPRPRYATPASYLELFDMAMRADGGFDGILKYMMDYTASPRYERGYIDRMVRNKPAYDWIDAHLTGGTAEGADIVSRYDLLRQTEFPAKAPESINVTPTVHSLAAQCALPFTFGTRSAHIVCGEDARTMALELADDGLLLDATAARLLKERGVDIGLSSISRDAQVLGGVEHYIADNEDVMAGTAERFYTVTLADSAEVLSTLHDLPSCYRYENAAGQRFVVLCFDMDTPYPTAGLIRSYCRQRQVIDGLEWAGRKKLPAVLPGEPDIYITCKRQGSDLAVGLWNLSADVISDARIRLDRVYTALELFGAEGALEDDCLTLKSDMAPFSFTGFVVKN